MRPISVTRLDCLAVLQATGLCFGQGQRRDVGQRGRDRKQEVRGSGRGIGCYGEFVQGDRLLGSERADAKPAERGNVAEGAAGDGEVAGQAAHIDALARGDLEDGAVRVGAFDQLE